MPVAVVHDPNARQIGEDHSPDRRPTTGLADVGSSQGPNATDRHDLADPPRAAIRMLGWCDDVGRLDMSWLYAPNDSDNTGEYRPTVFPLEVVMEEESLQLGLAVS